MKKHNTRNVKDICKQKGKTNVCDGNTNDIFFLITYFYILLNLESIRNCVSKLKFKSKTKDRGKLVTLTTENNLVLLLNSFYLSLWLIIQINNIINGIFIYYQIFGKIEYDDKLTQFIEYEFKELLKEKSQTLKF